MNQIKYAVKVGADDRSSTCYLLLAAQGRDYKKSFRLDKSSSPFYDTTVIKGLPHTVCDIPGYHRRSIDYGP